MDSKKKLLIIASTILLILALPVAVYLVSQRQTLKSRASHETGGKHVELALVPVEQHSSLLRNSTFQLKLGLAASSTTDVSGVDISMNFEKSKLLMTNYTPTNETRNTRKFELTLFPSETDLERYIQGANETGSFRFSAISPSRGRYISGGTSADVASGGSINLGTFAFRHLDGDSTTVGFNQNGIKVTDDSKENYLSESGIPPEIVKSTTTLTFVNPTSTPTPTNIPTLTPIPTPSLTPIPILTATPAPTLTPIPTPTLTSTPTPTNTPTPTLTPTVTPTPTYILGDADGNSCVDPLDYNIWLYESTNSCTRGCADWVRDGVVDPLDYNIWFNNNRGAECVSPPANNCSTRPCK